MPRRKKEKTQEDSRDNSTVYAEYVHGASISSIADKHDLEAQDVLEIINKVEQDRGNKPQN